MKTNFTLRIAIIAFLITFQSSVLFGQSWDWVRAGYCPQSAISIGNSIVLDKKNNIYIAGLYGYNLNFGNDTIYTNTTGNLFLVKFNSAGNLIWLNQPTDSLLGTFFSGGPLAIDNSGNLLSTGSLQWTVIFGSNTLRGGNGGSAFLVKYSNSGSVIWAKQAIPKINDYTSAGYSVICDNKNNIYLAGYFMDTVYFDNYMLTDTCRNGITNVFLVKYDSNGRVLWAKQSNSPSQFSYGIGVSVYCDKTGNAYLGGNYYDTITFGSFTLKSPNGNTTAFVVKYSPSGNILWAKSSLNYSSTYNLSECTSIITDEKNNLYVAGLFIDTVKFGSQILYSTPSYNDLSVYLTKYDSNGHFIWAKQTSRGSWESPNLAMDALNHIYFTGSGSGNFSFENLNFSNDSNAAFLLKLDTAGNPICGSIVANLGFDNCNYSFGGIISDPTGSNVFLANYFRNEVICGNDSLNPPPGGANLFVGRWNSCAGEEEDIEPVVSSGSYFLYPNPNNGQFNIQWAVNNRQQAVVDIYNVMGQEVYSKSVTNNGQLTINLANEPNGIYLCRLIDEKNNEIGTGKFVIER